jgi:isoprenylcysteine carboxyl methyltransferase (ICMT) family protein YpbQ
MVNNWLLRYWTRNLLIISNSEANENGEYLYWPEPMYTIQKGAMEKYILECDGLDMVRFWTEAIVGVLRK